MNLIKSIVSNRRPPVPCMPLEVSSRLPLPAPETAGRRRAALRVTAGCMAGEEGEDFERAVRETADLIHSR